MARPRKEGLDYFPHDTDALTDEKLEPLMMLYGAKGYAFYFILLERIYRTSNLELDVSDAETIQILARKITITIQEFDTILKTALKHKCFDKNEYEERGVLTSSGIKKRAAVVISKREKMRSYREPIVIAAETPQQTPLQSTQSIVKKSIVKKSKEKNIYTSEFDLFWSAYPALGHQNSKEQTAKNFMALVNKKVSIGSLIQSAKNYAIDCEVEGRTEFFYKASNFVGKAEYYKSYLDGVWIPIKPKQGNRGKFKQETQMDMIQNLMRRYEGGTDQDIEDSSTIDISVSE